MRAHGRPRIFDSPEDMEEAIDAYFLICEQQDKPITLTGALLHMGIQSRSTLGDYEKREGFSAPVKRLRLAVEASYEERLSGRNPTGAIFALKNMGWSDRTEIENVTSKSQEDLEREYEELLAQEPDLRVIK